MGLFARRAIASVALPLLVAWSGGCSGPGQAAPTSKPPAFEPAGGQSKCSVKASHGRPLIVEWPTSDRASLEAQTRRGLVAVKYKGCEMEVLRQCRVPGGKYRFTGVTKKRDVVRIRNSEELYANLPVYAAKLEANLERSGELNVTMTVVGTYDADREQVRRGELTGDCDGATHVISSIVAGAFQFFAGSSGSVSGSVSALGAGAGAKEASSQEMLNADGDEAKCDGAGKPDEPPSGCGALIRLEVTPLGEGEAPAGAQASAAAQKPPAPGAAAGAPGSQGGCPEGTRLLKSASRELCVDATEVTAADFGACVKEGKCSSSGVSACTGANLDAMGRDLHPMNCVDWKQANDFCAARGKRLPTEQEWEFAAQSAGARQGKYTWGDAEPAGQLCWKRGSTCAVGSFHAGDSAQGVSDLLGNVWEWTSTGAGTAKLPQRVIRGGGYDSKADMLSVTARAVNVLDGRGADLGFRCVKDL